MVFALYVDIKLIGFVSSAHKVHVVVDAQPQPAAAVFRPPVPSRAKELSV